ncbi:hypothetical protein TRIATDRAFT_89972 [Trichoderma atroviride IMI 206040]|uniref:Extracellular membrane protein CFEM domain-containing protein n=1 Tax=Hypocrea atroviridis (strain ATCC 20476 / IMI 206040) TaxID=452589 RepID=G9NRH6_HYPAI|nr:uncharacterized protein TRIATDRAFT_89972 [Trichoderma atroviride IMI 206040]EHK46609.1 hypothetical protein TRIATDRAFT_89972 [Trichoderma atroviride IMI 206040]
MTRYRAMQQLSLTHLVFLIGTASGALLTLSSFEGLASPAALSCIYAYNAPIRGCTANDFARGATCSETCVEGLQAVQFTVRSLCAKANAANNPLLQQIQNGNLVAAVCKTNTPASTPIPSPATTLQTSTIQTSTMQTSTMQTSTMQTSPPSQASPTPQSTSDGASQVTSTQQPVSTEAASSTAASVTPDHSITSVAVSTSAIESATQASQTSVEKPSSSSEEPSKPTRPINPNAQPGSGGGSPFDFVAISRAAKFNFAETFTTLATAAALVTLILM